MTTNGPIYQMVEQEIKKTKIKNWNGAGYMLQALEPLLPKIQELEQSQLKAHSDTMKECGEELDKYRWIQISERKPQIGQLVAVMRSLDEPSYFVTNWSEGDEKYSDWNAVKFWIPLPLPPTE